MRYRVYVLNSSPIEFIAFDFRMNGDSRIKCYLEQEHSYPGSNKCIDLFLPGEITSICDSHGNVVYSK